MPALPLDEASKYLAGADIVFVGLVLAYAPCARARGAILRGEMCAQCMTIATATVGVASGLRAWLAAKQPTWLTPLRLRRATATLISLAILPAGIGVG